MSYQPDQTDIQIIVQNQSDKAGAILLEMVKDEEEVDVEDIAELYGELLGALTGQAIDVIKDLVKSTGAKPKASKRSSGGSGSRSSASRNGGRKSSAKSGGASKAKAKASAKQVQFAQDLLEGREHDYEYEEEDLEGMTMKEIGALIEELLEAPELD